MGNQQIVTPVRHNLEDSENSRVTVERAGAKGQGVFAAQPIAEGRVAVVGRPVAESAERTWQTLQMDIDRHVRMDEPFELVNHSCDPSCGTRLNVFGGYDLVAMRDIEPGDEITFDYCMTEWACIGFTACRCGSVQCRETIDGARDLTPDKLRAYQGYVAPYLLPLLDKSI